MSGNAEGVVEELIALEHQTIGGALGTTSTTEEEMRFLCLAQLLSDCAAHMFMLLETVVGVTDCTLLLQMAVLDEDEDEDDELLASTLRFTFLAFFLFEDALSLLSAVTFCPTLLLLLLFLFPPLLVGSGVLPRLKSSARTYGKADVIKLGRL